MNNFELILNLDNKSLLKKNIIALIYYLKAFLVVEHLNTDILT